MKFGLIGLGRWGKNYITSINQMEGHDIVLCSSRKSDSYNNLAVRPKGMHNYTPNWEYVVKNPEVDTIIIATPPETHYEMALTALRNGKNVICEKPVTMNPLLTSQLNTEANIAGRAFIVDYVHLWNPNLVQIIAPFRENLKNLKLHTHLISQGWGDGPVRDTYSPLWDYGSHDISILLSMFPDFPQVIDIEQTTKDSNRNSYRVYLKFDDYRTAGAVFGNNESSKHRFVSASLDNYFYSWVDDFKTPSLLYMLNWFASMIDSGEIPNNLNLAYRVETLLSTLEAKLK